MAMKTLKIEGMTCAACAKAVERAVKKLQGVEEASVNLATEKLSISFDESKVAVGDIQKAVSAAGYKAVIEAVTRSFRIEGMTCAACAKAIERATRKLDGVLESNVNLATEKLTIAYEPSKLRFTDIRKAVSMAGYKIFEEEQSLDADKELKENEAKSLWRKFLLSAVFTVPLLYVAMGHMIGLPLPEPIDPMMNPKNFAMLQLILVLPVIVMGSRFYIVGF
ncbi:MAG TPA: copper ion binding protein, partial [Clostridiaceae bacterium]|nr:copper ion binding protein [Clostridiaceae bacterium]